MATTSATTLARAWDISEDLALSTLVKAYVMFECDIRAACRRHDSYAIVAFRGRGTFIGRPFPCSKDPMVYVLNGTSALQWDMILGAPMPADPWTAFGMSKSTWSTMRRRFGIHNGVFRPLTSLHETKCSSGNACPPSITTCPGCHMARYCCAACQLGDWSNGHRDECVSLALARYIALP